MPKVTFFNLPEDKRATLILSLKKEFSRVPLYDASISNIVKAAGIPRGSFYQYFEDKEDAFFFILNDFVACINHQFFTLIKKYNGDLFDTMQEFFQIIIEEEENVHFFRNAFLNMTYRIESTFSRIFKEHETNNNLKVLSSLLNTSILNFSSEEELNHLLQIISAVTFRNIVEKFAKELPNEEALRRYRLELTLLKSGLVRHLERESRGTS
ncbi:TetR/AcrR family transcriptional regulator [Neobacillus dielmonensis]|uniref:TetR/AcrR family transcriptional regulator n=1 Tax=Neobacillus dielmonensis TaxID=1347369 RepID=UPI0005A68C0E|nr:TetR/AcrR family transcriptional regulator [Neobacillus dielmonensis]